MKSINSRNLLIGLVMVLAFWGGFALKPTKHAADYAPKFDLETGIPKSFADWKLDETIVPVQADPERLALISKIYNQTLSRTYVNSKGARIMLSIAYGGDQSDNMQVHRPEVCYTGNGFTMTDLTTVNFETGYGVIPVKRVLATMSSRVEPITYWITIGDSVEKNPALRKLQLLKFGLTGTIPDGLLFRVSSIGTQSSQYPVQQDFVATLLKSVTPEFRKRLIGSPTL
jgi:EpsI family protein